VPDISEFRRPSKHPQGWEPSLQWNGKVGTITAVLENEPDDAVWAELIADWGLDPTRTMVQDGSLQIRAWDTTRDGETVRMKYYRCVIKPREQVKDQADVDELCQWVQKKKPRPVSTDNGGAFVLLLSDWQLGKSEGGGTEATVDRIMGALDLAVARWKKLGKPSTVYIIGLGDLVEACSGHYAMQTFQADLDNRQQDKLARRLILAYIDTFVDLGVRVIASGVPGNHGENRINGKAYTNWLDNRDYAVFETVGEILAANPERYANASIPLAINEDDLTMTLDINGTICAFAHGHQFRSGTNSQAKIEGWWKGQALGFTGVSDAQILFSGHFHHFLCSESTGRTVMQCPAMDGGSNWFTSTTGASSRAGMLSLLIGKDCGPRGWDDLKIL